MKVLLIFTLFKNVVEKMLQLCYNYMVNLCCKKHAT